MLQGDLIRTARNRTDNRLNRCPARLPILPGLLVLHSIVLRCGWSMTESQLIRDHAVRHIRLSITSMLVIVLFVAVGFAALRESSDLWESGVFGLTLGILVISIPIAIHRLGPREHAGWGLPFSGTTDLGFSQVPSIESRARTWTSI